MRSVQCVACCPAPSSPRPPLLLIPPSPPPSLPPSLQEVHGTGEVPADLCDLTGEHPDWVEAGRWLERQKDLYRRQKLLLLRVRLMKEVLGGRLVGGRGVGGWGEAAACSQPTCCCRCARS